LVSVATGADDLFIVGLGTRRFSVERWLDDDPYPRGEISLLPELEWSPGLASLWADAESVVRRTIERVAGPETAADIELSEDPVASAWQLAAIAPLGEYDRYTLLRSTSTEVLLRRLIDLTREAE
jgi:Lon protease-like protein